MPPEVLTRSAPAPDLVIRYGVGPDQVADLRLPPPARVPAPLLIFLHGGFWRAEYDRAHTGPLGVALATAGFTVCVPEFRRTGQPGGGWPGTFDDAALALDTLPGLVREAVGPEAVEGSQVLLGGHSAGGHLALWLASRHQLPAGSPWQRSALRDAPSAAVPVHRGERDRLADRSLRGVASASASRLSGVVALAAVSDLVACHADGLGQGAADALMDGGPRDHPERYRMADPAQLLPIGAPVRLIHGREDDRVPCTMSRDYAARAGAAGDEVSVEELAGADHFDLIDPLSAAWPRVLAAFKGLAAPG